MHCMVTGFGTDCLACITLPGCGKQPVGTWPPVVHRSSCAGCWRTHSRVLSLPLQQPLMVQCAAALLPGARVALVVHVRCMAQVPVVMRDVQVSPQCGLALQVMPDMCSRSMPLTLLPGSASSWTFVLNRVFGESIGVWEAKSPCKCSIEIPILTYLALCVSGPSVTRARHSCVSILRPALS
jgi:hypothetical protein